MSTQHQEIQSLFRNCQSTIPNVAGQFYMRMQEAHNPAFKERMLQEQEKQRQQQELKKTQPSPRTAALLEEAYEKQQKTNRDAHNERLKNRISQKS